MKLFEMKALTRRYSTYIELLFFTHMICFTVFLVIVKPSSQVTIMLVHSLSLSQMELPFSRQSVAIGGRFSPVIGSAVRSFNAIKQVRNVGEYLKTV